MDAATASVLLWSSRLLAVGLAAFLIAYPVKKWLWPMAKGLHDLVVEPQKDAERERNRADIWRKFDELNRRFDAAKESSDTLNRRLMAAEITQDSHGRELRTIKGAVESLGRRIENVEKVHDMCPRATDILKDGLQG